jgi:hypothetical protein
MKVGIMQPYFFPYIGYWQLINAVDKYVIYDDVNFIKGGWINRNNILVNKKANLINLQMFKASPNKLINEIELLGNEAINNKLLKTIEASYKKAPYFDYVFPIIEKVIKQNEMNLAKYLSFSLREICNYLDINTQLILSSDINKNNNLRGQDKVIEICRILNADNYINAIGGKALYSEEEFAFNGIQLRFLKTGVINYQQLNYEFVPNLSIIDVMMFNDPIKISLMLDNYELV